MGCIIRRFRRVRRNGGGIKMKSRYKGVYERRIDKAIEDNVNLIEINWINISVRESASGGGGQNN